MPSGVEHNAFGAFLTSNSLPITVSMPSGFERGAIADAQLAAYSSDHGLDAFGR